MSAVGYWKGTTSTGLAALSLVVTGRAVGIKGPFPLNFAAMVTPHPRLGASTGLEGRL